MHVSSALIFWLLCGCSGKDDREITVRVQAHSLASCPLPGAARLDLTPLGDFPISNRTSESLAIDATGTTLGFPASTLALEAKASADLALEPFIGYSERFADRFDFLLWPRDAACDVFEPSSNDSYPGRLGGQTLGFSSSSGLVMVAGSDDASSAAIVGALTFDIRTGTSYLVDPRKRDVLSEPRAFATISDFAGKLLVAGGQNPIHDPTVAASDTAEVYDPDPAVLGFEPDLLKLVAPRTQHAAVNLESGETALIGGRGVEPTALAFVEVVSPESRNSHLLEPLNIGRLAPTALRLSDAWIFVGGGDDSDGHPIGALEWRDTDASRLPAPWDGGSVLPARYDRAYAALPGGAVLAVGGCEDRAASAGEDCSAWCDRGCPPSADRVTQQSYDAFWVAHDGSITRLDFPWSAPRPTLVPGSDGRPWLIASGLDQAGQPTPNRLALYRFDPWQKRFDAVDVDLGLGRALSPAHLLSTGPDAFVWLDTNANGVVVRGARLGTRSAFTSDVPLVSLHDGTARPAHLAPDRAPDANVSYGPSPGSLLFSAWSARQAPACVWITDTEYGDFSAQIQFSSATPPSLRLGPLAISDPNSTDTSTPCQLPATTATASKGPGASCSQDPNHCIVLHRKGARLTLSVGTAGRSCNLDAALAVMRLPFGVCQSELGSSTVTQITVTRGD